MKSRTKFLKESLQLTSGLISPEIERNIAPLSSSSPNVLFLNCQTIYPAIPEDFVDIDEVIERDELDIEKAKLLSDARKLLAASGVTNDELTLAHLRLRAGLSQSQLAKMIGNSQPSYSKIESGRTDIMFSTQEKLIQALGISRDELAKALHNTLTRATYAA